MIILKSNVVSFITISIVLGLVNSYLLERVNLGGLEKQMPLHLSSVWDRFAQTVETTL